MEAKSKTQNLEKLGYTKTLAKETKLSQKNCFSGWDSRIKESRKKKEKEYGKYRKEYCHRI